MVRVKVAVTTGPHEYARLQTALPRKHVRQERIRGDVEGHAKENVRAALIELQVKPPCCDLRLEQAVAGRERHLGDFAGVPGGDDLAPRIRIAPDQVDEVLDLVEMATVGGFPVAPLL